MQTFQFTEDISIGPSDAHDMANGVIPNVKVLGLESRNGRTYKGEAVRRAAGLYEGAMVNVDHPDGNPAKSRKYGDRIGDIRNVRFKEGDGLYADLHINPHHAVAKQLMWDAKMAPRRVGLSHNVEGRTARGKDNRQMIEEISAVHSVDLVSSPATTNGLFESLDGARWSAPRVRGARDGSELVALISTDYGFSATRAQHRHDGAIESCVEWANEKLDRERDRARIMENVAALRGEDSKVQPSDLEDLRQSLQTAVNSGGDPADVFKKMKAALAQWQRQHGIEDDDDGPSLPNDKMAQAVADRHEKAKRHPLMR